MKQDASIAASACSLWDTVSAVGQREQASAPVNQDVLRLLRAAYAESGMTQEALARASGMPRSTLANILSPTAEPRLVHVNQMIKFAIAVGADARAWAAELEANERKRRGTVPVDVAQRRARKRPAPQVQKRAARKPSSKPAAGAE